ncbi:MAG: hypothetical protein LLG45_00570 [Actinomycetia bacterium]|nr:hypothetical protein [Actinomycetes bacterium]
MTAWAEYPPEKVALLMRLPAWCCHQADEVGPAITLSSSHSSSCRPSTICAPPTGHPAQRRFQQPVRPTKD